MTEIVLPPPVKNFVEISATKEIQEVIRACHTMPMVASITGSPGTGKSWAAMHYGQDYNCYFCTVTTAHKTYRGYLQMLCEIFGQGFNTATPKTTEMHNSIYRRLRDRKWNEPYSYGTPRPILFIDEAQLLHDDAVLEVQKLKENTDISVILISNQKRIAQTKSHFVATHTAITSRISWRVEIKMPTVRDIELICTAHNVEFSAINAMINIGNRETLRKFVEILEYGRFFAGPTGPLKLVHIELAISKLYSEDEALDLLRHAQKGVPINKRKAS